jgi:predicted HTH transcriptional regulator
MPWIEFKQTYADPADIGKYISALSNAARLSDQHFAYILWGVRNDDHAVIGTSFDAAAAKHQQQPLEFWIANRLNPSVSFAFKTVNYSQGRLVLLEIPAATVSPVEFDRTAYIRIGSATPRLSDFQNVFGLSGTNLGRMSGRSVRLRSFFPTTRSSQSSTIPAISNLSASLYRLTIRAFSRDLLRSD